MSEHVCIILVGGAHSFFFVCVCRWEIRLRSTSVKSTLNHENDDFSDDFRCVFLFRTSTGIYR